jgi:hypothetical protein
MDNISVLEKQINGWEAVPDVFQKWLDNREDILNPGLSPEPTIKILIFLALLDAKKACTYDDIREIFKSKNVIRGTVPDNTFRTSVLNLGKTLDKFTHAFELKSFRGKFQLIPRIIKSQNELFTKKIIDSAILLLDPPAIKAEEIACDLVEKAMLPFHALYFLEWSARWWQIFSSNEAQIRVTYESEAWEKLGIRERLLVNTNECISFVGLAPGEGLAEIELLRKILQENVNKKVHYIAIDSSQRLLRDHINLLKETLTSEINNGRLICAGVIANIFFGLRDTINRVRNELTNQGIINQEENFLPQSSSLLVTYLGNCLGNNYQDQETEIFSIIHSTFQNRPLEFLVGVSVMRSTPDEYKRNWDDFLLQTPNHLLEINKLLESNRPVDSHELLEFKLPKTEKTDRCPPIIPESYIVRHRIEGQIYRFYYKLAYDLNLSPALNKGLRPLPKGTLILLYNIIKYNMKTLVEGIETCGLFKIIYDKNYHQNTQYLAHFLKNNTWSNNHMLNKKISFRYYLFAFSNLIAAFGGGMILGKGAGIIKNHYLQGGSIFAFFIGTTLGLFFLQFIPSKFSKFIAKSFSISGGITSLILLGIYTNYSSNEQLDGYAALLFFLLLSIRFSFWFYSRVMRADSAAGKQQSIAWVELGYYIGMILGLIIWKFIDINIATALIIDASVQFIAGTLDFHSHTHEFNLENNTDSTMQSTTKKYDIEWGWRLACSVVFLTIAVQVVIFNLTHHISMISKNSGSYILAIFYFGVSLAAIICTKFNIYLSWKNNHKIATICTDKARNKINLNVLLLVLVLASAIAMAIYDAHLWLLHQTNFDLISTKFSTYVFYLFILIAAFFYEILVLAILDKIGDEEKYTNHSGMVMRTYGLMGVGAATTLWLLSITNNFLNSSLITLIVSLGVATIIIFRRNFTPSKIENTEAIIEQSIT